MNQPATTAGCMTIDLPARRRSTLARRELAVCRSPSSAMPARRATQPRVGAIADDGDDSSAELVRPVFTAPACGERASRLLPRPEIERRRCSSLARLYRQALTLALRPEHTNSRVRIIRSLLRHSTSKYMQVFRGVPRPIDATPCALTVGNFDGVHRGHQALLARVAAAARARNLPPAVMTFEPHPREFTRPTARPHVCRTCATSLLRSALVGHRSRYRAALESRFARAGARCLRRRRAGPGLRSTLAAGRRRLPLRRHGAPVTSRCCAITRAHGAFELEQMPTVGRNGEQRISSTSRARSTRRWRPNGRRDAARSPVHDQRPRRCTGASWDGTLGFPTLNLRFGARPAAQGIFAVRVHGLGDVTDRRCRQHRTAANG